MTPLELDRRDAAESRVTANRVVPAFDVLEDRHAGLRLRLETPAREQLALQRREEALAHGVVVGIAHRSHRGPHLRFLAAKAEGDRGVLRTVVGVMHDAFRAPLPERHVERGEHELGSQVLSHAPADDSATVGIEDHRQVQEPGPRRDVGNVGDPELVRASALNCRCTRSAEGCASPSRTVVVIHFRKHAPCSPSAFMSLATRFLPTRMPASRKSMWILGAPYLPLERAWYMRMRAVSLASSNARADGSRLAHA